MSEKATDAATGISIKFVKQYEMTADPVPNTLCICGLIGPRELFKSHIPVCPWVLAAPDAIVPIDEAGK